MSRITVSELIEKLQKFKDENKEAEHIVCNDDGLIQHICGVTSGYYLNIFDKEPKVEPCVHIDIEYNGGYFSLDQDELYQYKEENF